MFIKNIFWQLLFYSYTFKNQIFSTFFLKLSTIMNKNVVFFCSIFLILLSIILSSFFSIKLDNNILYLFGFVFIFILTFIIKEIKKDFSSLDMKFQWTNVIKYLIIIIYILISYKFFDYLIINKIIFWYILFSILFVIDSRISFAIALIFLSFSPIYLIIWQNNIAENLSIYAYYFLVIWVFTSIIESIIIKKLDNNTLINE